MAVDREKDRSKKRTGDRASFKAQSRKKPQNEKTDRKRADTDSPKRNAPHMDWLDSMGEGIVITQIDPLRIVYANPAMSQIVDYSTEELLALSPERFQSLIHVDDRVTAFRRFRERMMGKEVSESYELRFIRKDGSLVWASVRAARIEFAGEPATLAAVTDISAVKNAKLALRESEAKYKTLFKAIPVPTYTWQKQGDKCVLIDYNDAAEKITRGKIEDFIGISVREMYKDAPEIIRDMEQCLCEGQSIEREMEYRLHTTGRVKHFLVKYAFVPPNLVLVHTEDITTRTETEKELCDYKDHLEERIKERTAELQDINERLQKEIAERKKTESELRESETRYRAVVEDQVEFVTRFERDSTMTFINEAACLYFRMKREDVIGKQFFSMIHPEDRVTVERAINSLSAEQPVSTHDQRAAASDGEIRWQRWTNRALFDDDDRIIGYQAVGRDITQRKAAEEELERSNRELGVLNEINASINSSEDSSTILSNMLATIAEYCGARFAGLFEIEHAKNQMRLVASYGLPDQILPAVGTVGLDVASIEVILKSSGVVIAEEDMPNLPGDEYDEIKRQLGLHRIMAVISRSHGRVNFMAMLGRQVEGDVGERIRSFLAIVGNQLGIALERLRLLAALEKSKEELKKLASSLIDKIEEERRRMALSLHDDMGQSIIALNVEFDMLEKRIHGGGEIDHKRLDEIRRQLGDITKSTRQISYELHPPMLEELGLETAIQRYIDRFVAREGLDVDFEASGFDTKLPRQAGITLYRVAQEALTNIVRHAKAKHVVIRLTKGYPRVIMKIEDDGKGFVLDREAAKGGLGVVGMRERLERLGGNFRIHTSPGKGTSIRVTLPLEV